MNYIFRLILNSLLTGRIPSRRALAALAKLHGIRLEHRWPIFIKTGNDDLNLYYEDVLEFQFARSRNFIFMNIGAFDGLENDPISRFARHRRCNGILLEPQPGVFKRLCDNYRDFPHFKLLNMAIDETSGSREMYYIPPNIKGLPAWTEQLASFKKEHLLKHESKAPGLTQHIQNQTIQTISFNDLLDQFKLDRIDVLQIDAEGMDVQLLYWFPFDRIKPSVLHYETAHMSTIEHREVKNRLKSFGYVVREADSPLDDMAVIL